MKARSLVVGLGSPHGNDQAGWRVIERLLERGADTRVARKAMTPTAILDWCHADQPLILCDACQDGRPPGTVARWNWPDDPFPDRVCGTHDYPLEGVLSLGATLGCVPNRVAIWTISIEESESLVEPMPVVAAAAAAVADQLWEDLQRA